MRLFFMSSIRRSLIILVLFAVLPSLAILLSSGRELRGRVVDDVKDYTLRQVKSMTAHHERVVDNARLLLMALAKSSEVRNLDTNACKTILADIQAGNSTYVSLSLVDMQGNILVSVPEKREAQNNQSTFFQQITRSTTFSVGEYSFLPGQRRVAVQFGQPILSANKQMVGCTGRGI